MPRQTKAVLREHLREQVGFLRSSAQAFDDGTTAEAKRIAHGCRLLLYDALLDKFGVLSKMPFLDSAGEINSANLMSSWNLLLIRTSADGFDYVPRCEVQSYVAEWVPFDAWWRKRSS